MKNSLETEPAKAMVCALATKDPDLRSGAVETNIRSFIARNFLFTDGSPEFENRMSFVQQGIIDSLGVVELVTFARSEYGIEVNPAEVTPSNFDSVERLASYIRRKCGSDAGIPLTSPNRSEACLAKLGRNGNGGASEAIRELAGSSTAAPRLMSAERETVLPNTREKTSLVEIQVRGSKRPLFLVHGVGGGMFWGYSNLARHLGADQPVYAFKSLEAEGSGSVPIEEMANRYVEDLLEFQPTGPYFLGGYCFGGNVAYEMARQLKARNREVGLLLLMNCWPNNSSYTRLRWTPAFCAKALWNLCVRMRHQLKSGAKRPRDYFKWRATWARKRLAALFSRGGSANLQVDDFVDLTALPANEQRLWRAHVQAWLEYTPKPYDGHVVLFRTRGHPLLCSFDHEMGWGSFARKGVTVRICPGDHESILEEENVGTTARELQVLLSRIGESPAPSTIERPAPSIQTSDSFGPAIA